VHIRFEDDALASPLQAVAVTAAQPRRPVAEMQYAVVGEGRHTVLEEGDRLATGLVGADAVATVAARCRARVLDHLSLGGWAAARAGIAGIEGRRLLVLGDEAGALTSHARAHAHAVEGDELVFFRDGQAVCLPQPWSSDVGMGPVAAAVIVTSGHTEALCAPVASGEVVEALLAATLPSWTPRGQVLRAGIGLVGNVDGYRIDGRRVAAGIESLLAHVPGGGP
jgi:hypothetical protein